MSAPFDFKENAKALLKRVTQSSANPALALVAVETALREAYLRGQADLRGGASKARAVETQSKRVAASSSRDFVQEYEEECNHEWQEAFLDGRAVGSKCIKCEVLEKDVQKRCDHYFVKTSSGEVCVACRSPRRRPF